MRRAVMHVRRIKKSDQDIGVQKRDHQWAASSASFSTSSGVTTRSAAGITSKPLIILGEMLADESGASKLARANSEMTCPAVRLVRIEISLAAARTSASISSVVLIRC